MNRVSPFIVLLIINELCGEENSAPRNTGNNGNECLEGVLQLQFAARSGFSFPTLADFKSREAWLDAIEAKDIVPLYTARAVANANTDPTLYTTGDFEYQTSPGAEITTYECYLGFCSHSALYSYVNSDYTHVFELNTDGSILGINTATGAIKGRDAKITVGIRQRPVLDKPATTPVRVNYKDYKDVINNAVLIKTTWGADLRGIFDVNLTQVSATSTSIRFKAITDCGNRPLTTLTASDIIVRNAAGVVQTVTFVPADANGEYRVTGTTIVDGWTIEVDGVVVIGEVMYEADGVLTVDVT